MDRMLSSHNDINAPQLWIEKTKMEMEGYKTIVERNLEGTHLAEASSCNIGTGTSPRLAYLTVVPATQVGQLSLVQVLHIICDVPSLTPPHTVTCGIMGDSEAPVLPLIKEAPVNGLEPYFNDQVAVAWPSSKRMKAFYKKHCAAELLERDHAEDEYRAVPKLVFVPTTWIGAFLEPIPPSVAYDRAIHLMKLLPISFT